MHCTSDNDAEPYMCSNDLYRFATFVLRRSVNPNGTVGVPNIFSADRRSWISVFNELLRLSLSVIGNVR